MSRTREKPWWISDVRPHGNRWRFSTGGAGKAKDDYYSFPTEAEALKLRALFIADRDAQAAATFGETLARYAEHKAGKRKNKSATVDREIHRIRAFFNLDDSARLAPVTLREAERLYADLQQRPTRFGRPPSDAEHRESLKAARRLGKWLVKEGAWAKNPLEDVELVGDPKRGEASKAQLTRDEAEVWLQGALALHEGHEDAAALAAVLCLTCGGLRPIEAASLMTRDIDGGGAFLWIRAGHHGDARQAHRRLQERRAEGRAQVHEGRRAPSGRHRRGDRRRGDGLRDAHGAVLRLRRQQADRGGMERGDGHALRDLRPLQGRRQEPPDRSAGAGPRCAARRPCAVGAGGLMDQPDDILQALAIVPDDSIDRMATVYGLTREPGEDSTALRRRMAERLVQAPRAQDD